MELPSDFNSIVRLFPLPNVVLFPRIVLPLHLFEPRYRELTRDALATDRLITLVLTRPGWEHDYEGRPPLHDVVCIGQILTHAELPDGRYNILLQGMRRARLIEELPQQHLYREARVELLEEQPAPHSIAAVTEHETLLKLFRRFLPESPEFNEQFSQLLQEPLAPALLTDLVAYTAALPTEVKQSLLAECDIGVRTRRLIALLSEQASGDTQTPSSHFPPAFSDN